MTKHTDFHSGEKKFIKGRLPLERKLDGLDFNKSKDHNINTYVLNKLEKDKKVYKPGYIKTVKKHIQLLEENKKESKVKKIIHHHKSKNREECIEKLQKIIVL